MTTFRSRNHSVASVPVEPQAIWEVLTDPDLLADLTPLVERIEPNEATWNWTLAGISGLGLEVAPSFTARMDFVPISRIDFRHEPPAGSTERAGVEGMYLISDHVGGGSRLEIDLTLCVDLPLPRLAKRAVEPIMAATMGRTGDAFARNLYRHLGIDAADVEIEVLAGQGGS